MSNTDFQFEPFDTYFAGVPPATTPLSSEPLLVFQNGTTKQVPSSSLPGGSITINTTPIVGGTANRVLYDNAGKVGEASSFTISSGNPNVPILGSNGQYDVGGAPVIQADTTAGVGNYFFAGAGNTTLSGNSNIGIGSQGAATLPALASLTSGSNNIAIGLATGAALTTQTDNTFLGFATGRFVTSSENTAVGFGAMNAADVSAGQHTAIGAQAMLNWTGGGSDNRNVAIGYQAMHSATSGGSNVAIGFMSLAANAGGINNFALGANALVLATTASQNVAIGAGALAGVLGGGNNIGIGANVLGNVNSGSNNTCIGNSSGGGITTGTGNVILGVVNSLSSALTNAIILADGAGNIRLDYNDTNSNVWTLQSGLDLAYVSTAGILVADSSGNVTSDHSTAAATVAANFTADHRLQVTIGATTYYIAMSTTAW